jgi:hypothetical protein
MVRIGQSWLGRSVFANAPIPAGTRILEVTGPILRQPPHAVSCNLVQVGHHQYVDISAPVIFVNHSCEPNAGIRGDLWLVSIRAIEAGEQITFDYSTTMQENYWTMECDCRSPLCRNSVADFCLLPKARRHFYLSLGVVQPFIVRALSRLPKEKPCIAGLRVRGRGLGQPSK